MITLADCQAFCDADAGCIDLMAKEHSLSLIEACARAHAAAAGATPTSSGCSLPPGRPAAGCAPHTSPCASC